MMPGGMMGSRGPFAGLTHQMGAFARDKPFARNATHVAIAYFISADRTA